jgi:hypothetical protein
MFRYVIEKNKKNDSKIVIKRIKIKFNIKIK